MNPALTVLAVLAIAAAGNAVAVAVVVVARWVVGRVTGRWWWS